MNTRTDILKWAQTTLSAFLEADSDKERDHCRPDLEHALQRINEALAEPIGFTPGPWTVENRPHCQDLHVIDGGPECSCVVAVVGSNYINGVNHKRANAQLIASAPLLLATLEKLQANPNDPRSHRCALNAINQAKGMK